MEKVNSIEDYLEVHSHFAEALQLLRHLINSTELVETFKWNAPTYYLENKKVVALGAFKNHFSIWFHQGDVLKDEKKILVKASEKTKHLRQMRFNSLSDIDQNIVLSYLKEAIENQKI
ncbi:MAG: DUF1801 domain-containing protein [Gelidibacter sp.]|uniref:DUF1801 domain-containing protein n=1 Tax=Gelidibacter sp. TaxID=2018083 RepID=UPI003265581F